MQAFGAVRPTTNMARLLLARHWVLPLLIGCVFSWLLLRYLDAVDWSALAAAFHDTALWRWALAAVLTLLSFAAVSRYDVLAHRYLGTRVSPHAAMRSGWVATALAQTLGAGLITGAFARWRLLGDGLVTPVQSAKLTLCVVCAFFIGWSVITAAVLLIWPDTPPAARPAAIAVLGLWLCGVAALLWPRPIPREAAADRWSVMPTAYALLAILLLTFVDTACAAGALWVLLAPEVSVPFTTIFAIYLLALGAALVSGAPGGVGAFDLVVLALLAQPQPEAVLAGILAFRLIYYFVPAVLAGLALLRPRAPARPATPSGCLHVSEGRSMPFQATCLLDTAKRAEVQLARQGGRRLFMNPQATAGWVVAKGRHTLIAYCDPLGQSAAHGALFAQLRGFAQSELKPLCIYKCMAPVADMARAAGYRVIQTGVEAFISPHAFCINAASRKQLRRKIRQATAAGVSIDQTAGAALALGRMREISEAWARRAGGERRLSTGCFDAALISGQRVFRAHHQGRLCAFITLNETAHEWALDLMRSEGDTPGGTMHLLVTAAIEAAKDAGIARVSLAAAPLTYPQGLPRWMPAKPLAQLKARCGISGLYQFKAAFAPQWQPLDLAAPGIFALTLAALDLIALIRPVAQARAPEQSIDEIVSHKS